MFEMKRKNSRLSVMLIFQTTYPARPFDNVVVKELK